MTTPGSQRQAAAPEETSYQVYLLMHLRQEDGTV